MMVTLRINPCFDSCQLIITWMCNIRLHLGSQLAIKCKINYWLPCGADGRTLGVRSSDYQIFWDE